MQLRLESKKLNLPQIESNQRLSLNNSKKFWGKAIWVSLILMIVPPLIGTMGTAMGMIRTFNGIGQADKADPQELAANVSMALQTTAWGLVVSIVALPFFLVALSFYRKRRHALSKFL